MRERASTKESVSSRSSAVGAFPRQTRRSKQAAPHGQIRTNGKAEGMINPIVQDPKDGTIRTPKGLLHSGTIQVPAKTVAGFMSTLNEDFSHMQSDISGFTVDKFPSIGQFSTMASSATCTASEIAEEDTPIGASTKFSPLDRDIASQAATAEARREIDIAYVDDEPIKPADLDALVDIQLSETSTCILLQKAATVVSSQSEASIVVLEENRVYSSLLKAKTGNDNFVPAGAQTLSGKSVLKKAKECQAKTGELIDMSSQWDVCSLTQAQKDSAAVASAQLQAIATSDTRQGLHQVSTMQQSLAPLQLGAPNHVRHIQLQSPSNLSDLSNTMQSSAASRDISVSVPPTIIEVPAPVAVSQVGPLAHLDGLQEVLTVVERVVAHNMCLDQTLLYRGMQPVRDMLGDWGEVQRDDGAAIVSAVSLSKESVSSQSISGLDMRVSEHASDHTVSERASSLGTTPTIATSGATKRAHMQPLWRWACDLTAGRTVSCTAWNHHRPDVLAVGYGSFDFGKQQDGLVCIWSLQNPSYPIWYFMLKTGVTALDVSSVTGSVLAVGEHSGNVSVFDMKSRCTTPVITSDGCAGKHLDPVWKVRWLDTGPVASSFVSISTDGRITRWHITKGLQHKDLMKLKRVLRPHPPALGKNASVARSVRQEAFISRLTGGMAIDFARQDERIYLAGTEDGWIHRCSTSYSEQYMRSYQGHMGPVYNVQWCPFNPDLFLSCSADWTVRLWRSDRTMPLLTFHTVDEEVYDAQWCPSNSTVFACVTAGGCVEVWDLAQSTLRPVAKYTVPGVSMTSVCFNVHDAVLVAGDSDGGVTVLCLLDVNRRGESDHEQRTRLNEVVASNVMRSDRWADPLD